MGNTVRMSIWAFGALIAGGAALVGGGCAAAHFTQERVEISAYPSYFDVDGAYLFENVHFFPLRQTCSFPVAEGNGIQPPPRMEVYRSRSGETGPFDVPVSVHEFNGKHWFSLWLRPKEKLWFAVRYRQEATARNGGYIVTSTQSWHKPLDKAVFRLSPHGIKITKSSYPLSETESPGTLGFEWHDYMPTHDWAFSWEGL